ncbi:hypothetical protein E2C01_025470 [Portunus trituberculatus]|uniref:Uncharacterized protein n=1 Tax=Portunus trituberculatus TaxID=210409 RepID=A0A5B7EI08_PORTR|nr:hypothetical protein [Portunus trituberculatus]
MYHKSNPTCTPFTKNIKHLLQECAQRPALKNPWTASRFLLSARVLCCSDCREAFRRTFNFPSLPTQV